MKKSFWGFIIFLILLALPSIPIFTSLLALRGSVLVDQEIQWKAGEPVVTAIPEAPFTHFEIRLEAQEPQWNPQVKARWSLLDSAGQVLVSSGEEGKEWPLTRPLTLFTKTPGAIPSRLEIQFLNSNPENHTVRLRVSEDRGFLLAKSERLFIVLLALSLGLLLVIRKPFLIAPPR